VADGLCQFVHTFVRSMNTGLKVTRRVARFMWKVPVVLLKQTHVLMAGNCTYNVKYEPISQPDDYSILILVDSQHIKGSPFKFSRKQ